MTEWSSRGGHACQQSLCCSVSTKIIDLSTSQKPVCGFVLVNNIPCFRKKNWTLCYFIISLLWQLRIAWKFPEVYRRCCLLWIWKKCVWFVNYSLLISLQWNDWKLSSAQAQNKIYEDISLCESCTTFTTDVHKCLPLPFALTQARRCLKT